MAEATPKTAEELARGMKSCANWCFWIAGLTAVNAGMAMSGSDQGFVLGTIMAQVVMQWAAMSGSAAGQAVALGFNLVVIGFFIGLGMLARRGRRWAFVVAILAYGADTLLLLLDPSFLPLAFHAWALFSLGAGWLAAGAWRKALAAEAAGTPISLVQSFERVDPVTAVRVDEVARETEEMMQRLYAPKHDRRLVEANAFKVDHAFYERTTRWLEQRGYRTLGDYELADLKGTPQEAACFLRVTASEDGTVTAAMFHFKPRVLWLRLLMQVLARGGMKTVEFQTEFSDGTFVCTSNAKLASAAKLPREIDTLYLPAKTALEELQTKHLERVAAYLERNPAATVRLVRTLEDAFAAEDRQDARKAAFRQEVGGMTREELFAHADTPAKRDAAEKIWARLQARKGTVEAPPVLPHS